ncbi:MAG: photosystem reaction center subunit H [Flavobacteriaceae bacterium]|nr:photosystem reaction center subunit H [Flavobacteriaceae bacterium]
MSNDTEKKIYYLDELNNYKVSNSDKDARGWDVKDKDGRVVGKVENLIVNKETERTVYLDVEVDDSIIEAGYKPYRGRANDGTHVVLNEDGDNHLIIPIGLAHLNLESEIVFTESVDHETFAKTKRKKKNLPITRDYELLILETYNQDADYNRYKNDEALYNRKEFDY